MISEKLSELLDHLEARERATSFKNPGERLGAALHEFEEEDMTQFVSSSILASIMCTAGTEDPLAPMIAMLTIGLELGRELERRAA